MNIYYLAKWALCGLPERFPFPPRTWLSNSRTESVWEYDRVIFTAISETISR